MSFNFSILFVFLIFLFSVQSVKAQSELQSSYGVGVANYYMIIDEVEEGDIIVKEKEGYKKSYMEYQASVLGVVVESPAIAINPMVDGAYPIVSIGDAMVKVSNSNGDIKEGDLLTTSAIPGYGMKMSSEGYAIGIAKESAQFDGQGLAKISVYLDTRKIEPRKGFETPQMIFKAMYSRVTEATGTFKIVKYFVSGTLLVVSLVFLLVNLKRIAQEGIKAMGRNPLAGKVITLNILLNLILTFVICGAGLILSYVFLII